MLNKINRILIVDDEKGVRESLPLIFEDKYEVVVAANGEEALQKIKSQQIDLVLLDVRMPGISGVETLRKIKEINEGIKVIMLTAVLDVETGIEALQLGADDYIVKPIDVFKMQKKTDEIFKSK